MKRYEVRFKGGAGCLFLLVLISVPEIFQIATVNNASAQITPGILTHLKGQYIQSLTSEYEATLTNTDPHSPAAVAYAQRLEELQTLQIQSLSIKTFGPGATARVIVSVNGAQPPDGKTERYFNLRQGLLGTWSVKSTTDATFYSWRLW